MKRTTIMLPDELDERLRFEARRRGVAIAEVVRQALEEHLPELPPTRKLRFFAIGRSGSSDGSARVDEIVAEAIERRFEEERLGR